MNPPIRFRRAAACPVLAALILAGATSSLLRAQPSPSPQSAEARELDAVPLPDPALVALPLAEDRGLAAAEQDLKRLSTTASVMMIVAHPDDEDGSLLTYLSRGLGVRATLLTLTRGEGGQNAMSADTYDALGVMRTNELLKADEYYGAKQLWGTEADFGFSKTQEEAFSQWGHDRVLYDAVLAVRRERPQVIVATFIGAITDGHGQHQVSGEIAQEVFKAAGDPKVFPEQLKDGLQPWQPLAVYGMVPFAPVTGGKMFDYATGKWAPARFKNYVTGEVSSTVPSTDVTLPVGTWDPVLGQSYMQIARTGWGEQKSQNGGGNPHPQRVRQLPLPSLGRAAPVRRQGRRPHRATLISSTTARSTSAPGSKASPPSSAAPGPPGSPPASAKSPPPSSSSTPNRSARTASPPRTSSPPSTRRTLALYAQVSASKLDPEAKASLLFELDAKIQQFQTAFKDLLGLDLVAFTTREDKLSAAGPFRGGSADETPRSVEPGEKFLVRVHTGQAATEAKLDRVWLRSSSGDEWASQSVFRSGDADAVSDRIYSVHRLRQRPAHPALLHPPHHRAALLRHRQPRLARAFLRPISACRLGRIHLRRPAHPTRPGRSDHAARPRPRRHLSAARRHPGHRRPYGA